MARVSASSSSGVGGRNGGEMAMATLRAGNVRVRNVWKASRLSGVPP